MVGSIRVLLVLCFTAVTAFDVTDLDEAQKIGSEFNRRLKQTDLSKFIGLNIPVDNALITLGRS